MRVFGFISATAALAAAILTLTVVSARQTSTGEAKIGGDFSLIDTQGKQVKNDAFRGKLMLVYMGYSRCPDICPMTLGVMSETIKQLGPADTDRIAFLFISLDPDYDTPAMLKTYLSAFDPHIIGLTGTKEQVAKAAEAYRVFYTKAPAGNTGFINHSGFLYLMDANGKYVAHFGSDVKAPELAAAIRKNL